MAYRLLLRQSRDPISACYNSAFASFHHGHHLAISSLALRRRAGARPAGRDPTLRQDHPGHAGNAITTLAPIIWSGSSSASALPGDSASDNVYTRAAASFQRLAAGRAFCARIAEPSLYRYLPDLQGSGQPSAVPSAGALSALGGSRNTPPEWSSATSRPWPSPRPTGWTCCALPAPTSGKFSCCTAEPAAIDAALHSARSGGAPDD